MTHFHLIRALALVGLATSLTPARAQEQLESRPVVQGPFDAKRLGSSIAIEGDLLAIGDRTTSVGGPFGTTFRGAVYVFRRTEQDTWEFEAKVLPPIATQSGCFGVVALLEGELIVGDPCSSPDGHVHVFHQQVDGSWLHSQTLDPAPVEFSDGWGSRVIATDDRLVVGSMFGTGPIRVHGRGPAGEWVLEQILLSEPDGPSPQGDSMDARGDRIVADGGTTFIVYDLVAGDWVGHEVDVPDEVPGFEFADQVCFGRDTSEVFATGGFQRRIYVFRETSPLVWEHTQTIDGSAVLPGADFGEIMESDGERLVVGNEAPSSSETNELVLYELDGTGTWTPTARYVPNGLDTAFDDEAPTALAIQGDRVLVAYSAYRFDGGFVELDAGILRTNATTASLSSGGTVDLVVRAGPQFASHPYVVVGSATAVTPALPLGVGGLELPLVVDTYTSFALAGSGGLLTNWFGVLDPSGAANATFALPAGSDAALAGTRLHHAVVAFAPPFLAPAVVGGPTLLELVP